MYCSLFTTDHGVGAVYATEVGVVAVEIPDLSRVDSGKRMDAPKGEASPLTIRAADRLQEYFAGGRPDFHDIPVDLGQLPLFRQNVLQIIRHLSYGEISSYGRVAQECGSPGAARSVGGALAANPVPIIIPCHRVIAADGRLTGFSAPGGEASKRALLLMEGVEFKGMQVVLDKSVLHRNFS